MNSNRTETSPGAPDKSVLMIGNLLSSSVGNRAIAEEMASRMRARGWEVHAASTRRGRIPRLADMLWTCWRKRNRYRVAQVDVFSGPAFLWAEAVCRMLRALGKPYVLVLRGGNLPSYLQRQPQRVARLLRSARAVAAPSGYLVEQLADCRGDIRLIPNAVETGDYLFRHRTRPAPRLVWLRSFHKLYNPAMAVVVLSRVAPEFPEATLLMVGPDKGDGTLQETVAAARRLGVEDRVEFQGTVAKKDVPRWISRGDIFLNTTNVDNTPVSVVEAMACGTCIVSTDVGGVPYLLEHEHDALLVPPRDPDAMAGAVRRVLTEPDLAGRLSANARLKAATFDWSAVLGEWERLLRSLSEGREPVHRATERSFQS